MPAVSDPAAPSTSVDVWAVICGGGTAGHVSPGLAIAQALVDIGHPAASIHYVGSERGIETQMVPAAGFALTVLPGRGIQRRFTRDNIGAVLGLVRAFGQAFVLLGRMRPHVVVALGGYASVPAACAATIRRIPIVVAEQNAVPGLANRLVSKFAKVSAVSFADTRLPRAVVTGNPVREEIRGLDVEAARDAAREDLGISPHQVMIAVFGGSLGARRINTAVLQLAKDWQNRNDVYIRHVIGERDWDRHHDAVTQLAAANQTGAMRYEAVRYEHDMASLYAAADVIVCRSGASSVAELTSVGVASVLVPLPGAPGDHQTANAQALVGAGAAKLIVDGALDATMLGEVLDPLVRDRSTRRTMAAAARRLARPDAAEAVAKLVEEHARG